MTSKETLLYEYQTQVSEIAKSDAIILFGKSVIYPIMKIALSDLGIEKKCYLFDGGKFETEVCEEICKSRLVVFLCGARATTRKSMSKDANKYFDNPIIFDYFAIYYSWLTSVIKRNCDYDILANTLISCRKEEAIANIDSINTFYCNLNCKECSNGIQFRKEKRHISKEKQIYYLNKITDILPISECNFQGGEVFCENGFQEFMFEHAKNPRIGVFTVATNGTILPSDEFYKAMRETGAMFRISNYGNLSKCMNQIIDKAKQWNVPCIGYPRAEEWRKFGEFKENNRSEVELKKICSDCYFGTKDMMFYENKLICCLRTLFADALQYDAEPVRLNTLDLECEFTRTDLEDIVNGKFLWRMCDFCDYPMEIIEPAEQMDRR